MRISSKGLVLTALHVALVAGTGGVLLYDRATLPRVWVKTAPFDPNLPIRGRYVRLALEVENPERLGNGPVALRVEGDRLVVHRADGRAGNRLRAAPSDSLAEPVAFFIPEHIDDPSRRAAGEELWVEVTVPAKGPPRPIRLGVKKDGVLTPLSID